MYLAVARNLTVPWTSQGDSTDGLVYNNNGADNSERESPHLLGGVPPNPSSNLRPHPPSRLPKSSRRVFTPIPWGVPPQTPRVVLLLFVWLAAAAHLNADQPLGLVINEDNSHFFLTRTADEMTVEGLHAWVDQYAGTKVSHLFLCPNAMKASFKSKTRDAIWELGNQDPPTDRLLDFVNNPRILHERGLDPYAIWIARCREKGISPWLTMRMNDVHNGPDRKSFQHSTFWVEHQHYHRGPADTNDWFARALDYNIADVREHALSFIRELLERYDPDGIELDWMRFGYHFRDGEEKQGRDTLIAFMREVRELADGWAEKRGHAILIGARVPTHPDAAAGLGMDGVEWVRQGLVDMLVPTPFFMSSDFDIPIELWRERIGPAADNVILAAGLEHNMQAGRRLKQVPHDLASVRGFVAGAHHRGADQIYLFNFMDSDTRPVTVTEYRELVEKGLDLETVMQQPRRYVVCHRDTVPPGFPNDMVLPAERKAEFKLYVGPKPTTGRAFFVLGLEEREGSEAAAFTLRMNGLVCQPIDDVTDADQFPGFARGLRFGCPLLAISDGHNSIQVVQRGDQADQRIVWAELRLEP